MNASARSCLARCVVAAALGACGTKPSAGTAAAPLAVAPDVQARAARFVREAAYADTSRLTPGDQTALGHLVRACHIIDEIFARQAWRGSPAFAPKVAALTGPDAAAAQEYYRIMVGPWDRCNGFAPFLGSAPHPPGAGFYPEDMSTAEFDAWLAAHPGDRAAFTSPLTVIRRRGAALVAIPYSTEYHESLVAAAAELRAAAAATTNASLKRFLALRADAFLSDEYAASDLAWMDLDSPLEVVIGPYATHEDGLFGRKAAFAAFVAIAQPADARLVAGYENELPFLASRLPLADKSRRAMRGRASRIRVADEVISGGEARCGAQALVFTLPDGERAGAASGSKKVLLKNMVLAEFNAVLQPVGVHVLEPADVAELDFDAYFDHLLFRELAHGLGPQQVKTGGRETEVRAELRALYPLIEEAKADVLGVYGLAVLANKGIVPTPVVSALPWTYLAELFRAARSGTGEADGLAAVLQVNYLLDKGAFAVAPDGRFRPVLAKFAAGIKALAGDLLLIEAQGSYAGARELVQRYGTVRPAMASVLASLVGLPVDVEPVFTIEDTSR